MSRLLNAKVARRNQAGGLREQSPGQYVGHIPAYNAQVKKYGLRDNPMYAELPNEQIHHIRQAAMFNGLFKNTTPEEGQQLAQKLTSGNLIGNLISVLPSEHQGVKENSAKLNEMAIHNYLRSKGLARESKRAIRHELFDEMDMAENMPFEYKMHLADRYMKELDPKIREATDEALTYHARARGEDSVHLKRAKALEKAKTYKNSSMS